MKITLCSSAAFYKELLEIREELEKLGFDTLVPLSAEEMKAVGDFTTGRIKTWYKNPADFHKKTAYVEAHLKKIDQGDVILVINLEKNGITGYIGGNVLLEIFYAWLQKKPVYIMNSVNHDLPCYEEVMGMNPIFIDGDLSKIK